MENIENIKRKRFIQIAERRVNRIMDDLESLGKCSNRRNYEYEEDEVRKIFSELEKKIRETKILFQAANGKQRKFSLK